MLSRANSTKIYSKKKNKLYLNRIIKVGKGLQDPVQQLTSSTALSPRTTHPTHLLSTSRRCDSTIPLLSLSQCLTIPLGKKFFFTSNLNFPQHFLPSCHLLCLGHEFHTASARGLQATGGWRCLSVNSVPLLFPTPLDQLCIEDFPEIPFLGPRLWGKKRDAREEQTTSAESAASSGT